MTKLMAEVDTQYKANQQETTKQQTQEEKRKKVESILNKSKNIGLGGLLIIAIMILMAFKKQEQ